MCAITILLLSTLSFFLFSFLILIWLVLNMRPIPIFKTTSFNPRAFQLLAYTNTTLKLEIFYSTQTIFILYTPPSLSFYGVYYSTLGFFFSDFIMNCSFHQISSQSICLTWLKTLWNRINSKVALKMHIFISFIFFLIGEWDDYLDFHIEYKWIT